MPIGIRSTAVTNSRQVASSSEHRSRFVAIAPRLPVLLLSRLGRRARPEFERHARDGDVVAWPGALLLQAALHAGADQPALQRLDLMFVLHIRLADPPVDTLAGDAPAAAVALD